MTSIITNASVKIAKNCNCGFSQTGEQSCIPLQSRSRRDTTARQIPTDQAASKPIRRCCGVCRDSRDPVRPRSATRRVAKRLAKSEAQNRTCRLCFFEIVVLNHAIGVRCSVSLIGCTRVEDRDHRARRRAERAVDFWKARTYPRPAQRKSPAQDERSAATQV